MGHPHLANNADVAIERRLRTFIDENDTQTVVIEGTQGTGKTNILEFYKEELSKIFSDEQGYYIVRYYADPEPDFGAVVRRIIQEFGSDHIRGVANALRKLPPAEQKAILGNVQNVDMRTAFYRVLDSQSDMVYELILEFLMGMRILKRHTEALGVRFRLDTTESKIQAFHDLVNLSRSVDRFKAIFLFLDELEKQGAQSPAIVQRYLSAIRALIDALPKYMFLVMAMTPDARRRYSQMLPALAGRLRLTIELFPLADIDEAVSLGAFYLDRSRDTAASEVAGQGWSAGAQAPLDDDTIRRLFTTMKSTAERFGVQGVTQRSFLERLYSETEKIFDMP